MSTTKYITKDSTSDKVYLGTTTSPGTLVGATGDRKGMLAADDNYVYYCTNDYIGSATDVWKTLKFDTEVNTTATYRALLTQTGPITGSVIWDFNYGLIIGEAYTITTYVSGDDFSNIADVQSGSINTTGCVFIATGEIPTDWNSGSQLTSDGGLIVDVLENTLGYDLSWDSAPFGGYGYYIATNNDTGPLTNSFPRKQTDIKAFLSAVSFTTGPGYPNLSLSAIPGNAGNKDNCIGISVIDINEDDLINDTLYYTPIEIKINQDLTPIIIQGTIESTFSFSNPAFTFYRNGISVTTYYTNNSNQVNNATELASALNNNPGTNKFGTFSVGGSGGIILTMTMDTKNKFAENATLTFEAFSD